MVLTMCDSATTHTDLVTRARSLGIAVHVVHNASVMTAVGACGINLYNYGQTVSIPFFTETWQPDSFYDRIAYNLRGGMHTLCLLGSCAVHRRASRRCVAVLLVLASHRRVVGRCRQISR
jgi:diphthamide biosynthesis methyltransferase